MPLFEKLFSKSAFKFGLFTQKYKWESGMGGVLANFFKKITLNFLTSGARVPLFTNMFSKIDLRFGFFVENFVWYGGMEKVLNCFSKV